MPKAMKARLRKRPGTRLRGEVQIAGWASDSVWRAPTSRGRARARRSSSTRVDRQCSRPGAFVGARPLQWPWVSR